MNTSEMSSVFRRANVPVSGAAQSQETPQCELDQAKEGPFPLWERGKSKDGVCAPSLQPHLFPLREKLGYPFLPDFRGGSLRAAFGTPFS